MPRGSRASRSTTPSIGCQPEDARGLACAGAVALPVHPEGAAAHHARRAARELRRHPPGVPRRGRALGPKLAPSCFSCRPLPERPRGPLGLPRAAAAAHARRVRVPPRVVARRRGVRRAEGAEHRPVHRRRREATTPRAPRPTRLLPAARRGVPAGRTGALGTIGWLAPAWDEVFVYFKHEDEGKGPEFASLLSASSVSNELDHLVSAQ